MESVLAIHDELKTQDHRLEHRHGFESVGVILKRLLEEEMTEDFDPALSLKLDALVLAEQRKKEEGVH